MLGPVDFKISHFYYKLEFYISKKDSFGLDYFLLNFLLQVQNVFESYF